MIMVNTGPRCSACDNLAIYEYETTMVARIYTLTEEGERHNQLHERQPMSSVNYYCQYHARPFLPQEETQP